MTTTVLFFDPITGEVRQSVQPFQTIEELRAAEAQVLAALTPPPGVDLDLVGAFMNSLEDGTFDAQTGDALAALTDGAFISALYSQILRRPADSAGSDYWLEYMKNGMSREDVYTAFMISEEALSISSPEQVALLGQHFTGMTANSDMG